MSTTCGSCQKNREITQNSLIERPRIPNNPQVIQLEKVRPASPKFQSIPKVLPPLK